MPRSVTRGPAMIALFVAVPWLLAACDGGKTMPAAATTTGTTPANAALPRLGEGGEAFTSSVTATVAGKEWAPPPESEIGSDSAGMAVRRGLALVRHMTDSIPDIAPGHINCTNCHLQDGRARYGSPLTSAYARYPRYIARSGAVVTIEDRVNFCITRSLAGNRLSSDSREMADIVAYLAWLSKGLPVGYQSPGGDGMPVVKAPSAPNLKNGAALYEAKCQSCHQADGQGIRAVSTAASTTPVAPPAGGSAPPATVPAVWGPASYSVGASIARVERAASFIAHNMPYGQAGTLTLQEAFDVAAYINSQPRPDLPGKENDWPGGDVPADLPYSTKSGHQAVNAPPLLPRRTPERALVPPPPQVRAGSGAALPSASHR